MPTYDYKCEKCGEFEHKKKMSDPDLKKCPKCGQGVKRLFTTGGVVWKCDGSYSKVNS